MPARSSMRSPCGLRSRSERACHLARSDRSSRGCSCRLTDSSGAIGCFHGVGRGCAGKPLPMALPPRLQRVDHRTQALTDLRQAIFHPGRHLGIDLADHQIVVLERAELFCQHALGDAGHPPPQLAETLGAVLQVIQDDALPLAIDQIERRFDRAARPMSKIPPFHGSFSNSIQTGTISPNLQYLPKIALERQLDGERFHAIRWETTDMKAVGYKKSLPIDAADALIDFETAK